MPWPRLQTLPILLCAVLAPSAWGGGAHGQTASAQSAGSAETQASQPNTLPGLNAINHIIVLAQENRSFDHYFGELRQYWADNGYSDESFDGLPQFNPLSGPLPHYGPPPTNPGCDPNHPPPQNCLINQNSPRVGSFQLITQCIENPSPSWNESHADWDLFDQVGLYAPKLNGYVYTAAHDARVEGFYDVNGERAMGYYTGNDLNYYYFMASNFATSDRWFSPVMTRTAPNRAYLFAATSQGAVYPQGTDNRDRGYLTARTIFQELQAAGDTWKIYVNPTGSPCSGPPYDPACLLTLSYIQYFKWGQTIPTQYPGNIDTTDSFLADLQNGTLPAVAEIEPATDAGFDEHPSVSDAVPTRMQDGAAYVASLINAVMASNYWKDTVFILTYDEFGGLGDHVAPQSAVSPDGIKPRDLLPGDACTKVTGPLCDFVYTGYRVPLIVISPYTKQHYVSHTVTDYTAILKLIETRFQLPPLTQRDAAQMDMTEFFDFVNPPWMTPPTPPIQNTGDPCYLNQLP